MWEMPELTRSYRCYSGIERICSQAGVTARHFYDEFGSRETLPLVRTQVNRMVVPSATTSTAR